MQLKNLKKQREIRFVKFLIVKHAERHQLITIKNYVFNISSAHKNSSLICLHLTENNNKMNIKNLGSTMILKIIIQIAKDPVFIDKRTDKCADKI
ncbi:MAG TPA: hypothetical protein ACHBZA_08100 [Arsenophonus apicola]